MIDIRRNMRAGFGAGVSRGALMIAGILAAAPALAQTSAAPAVEAPQEAGSGAEGEEVIVRG